MLWGFECEVYERVLHLLHGVGQATWVCETADTNQQHGTHQQCPDVGQYQLLKSRLLHSLSCQVRWLLLMCVHVRGLSMHICGA